VWDWKYRVLGCQGLEFRAYGLGLWSELWGVSFRVLWLEVWGRGLGVEDEGFRVEGCGFRVQGSGFRI